MSFYQVLKNYPHEWIQTVMESVTPSKINRILGKPTLNEQDFLSLLSPQAGKFLEPMAQRARKMTINQFGRTILLFTPMYRSNFGENQCIYCGFNASKPIRRKQLSMEEVEKEARRIAESGLKHILILTGEARKKADLSYLKSCCDILSTYFTSISIEIYPMTTPEYASMIESGVDSLTIYQETYHEALYDKLHVRGPKKDYQFRLDAPERGCRARMHGVNIGALLGLDEWRREAFYTGLHASYLHHRYPEVEISVSLPRMRPHAGSYNPEYPVGDAQLVQIMTALRLFIPRAGITISTRENATFRDNILPLGVTKMSAGVSTRVGGHTQDAEDTGQFDISDERSVKQMAESLKKKGFQPVYKDWQSLESMESRHA